VGGCLRSGRGKMVELDKGRKVVGRGGKKGE